MNAEVEVRAEAGDTQLRLSLIDCEWLLEVKYIGPHAESNGRVKTVSLGTQEAAAVMALFVAADLIGEVLEEQLYAILKGKMGDCIGRWSPIP